MKNNNGQFKEIPIKERYGSLIVLGFDHKTRNNQYYMKVKCDCGKEFVIRKTLLTTEKQNCCRECSKRIGVPTKSNEILVNGDVAQLILGDNTIVLIDTDDVDKIKQHYWHKDGSGRYIRSYTANTSLHKYVYGKDIMLDHINGDTMDNRKSNLRPCSHQQNCVNRKQRTDNTSGITGVMERNGKYIADLTYKGIRKTKTCKTFEEAVRVRKSWEEEFFKEWARK